MVGLCSAGARYVSRERELLGFASAASQEEVITLPNNKRQAFWWEGQVPIRFLSLMPCAPVDQEPSCNNMPGPPDHATHATAFTRGDPDRTRTVVNAFVERSISAPYSMPLRR